MELQSKEKVEKGQKQEGRDESTSFCACARVFVSEDSSKQDKLKSEITKSTSK